MDDVELIGAADVVLDGEDLFGVGDADDGSAPWGGDAFGDGVDAALEFAEAVGDGPACLLYTSPSPRD